MAYGFEAYRPDGSTMVSTKSGVARIIFATDKDANFSGNISVPAFDSNLGYFSFSMYPFYYSYNFDGYRFFDDSANFSQIGESAVAQCFNRGPNLSWNNSTKILSVTPNNEPESLFEETIRHRYRIVMVHFK
jgi:hypothetical protein